MQTKLHERLENKDMMGHDGDSYTNMMATSVVEFKRWLAYFSTRLDFEIIPRGNNFSRTLHL